MVILAFVASTSWAETAEDLYQKGYEAYEVKNYDEAIKLYKRAISINSKREAYHSLGLGIFYYEKGILW